MNNCDALGSPGKMTNESGSVTWTGAYYPFGEMITGAGNVHGFTGKELDSETGLNYFCLRYYDSQIGRFMTLDRWTNLPDDERLFSYERYLSWENHRVSYTPKAQEKPKVQTVNWKNRVFSYVCLASEMFP